MLPALRALANDRRLQILEWLRAPEAHFPRQEYGDLVRDGVCGVFIARKLGLSQPTASEHLRLRVQAGLLWSRRIRQWTFCQRHDARLREVRRALRDL